MACQAEEVHERLEKCRCQDNPPDSILRGILGAENRADSSQRRSPLSYQQHGATRAVCSCEQKRKVVLNAPEDTCRRASEVLRKTVAFIRNLPSFYQLPPQDQALLLRQCWAPLFVLGLAQDKVDFSTKQLSAPSLLKQILLNQSQAESEVPSISTPGAQLAEVQQMKCFLGKIWGLSICAKEFAYLKGIVLFNPEMRGLRFPSFVQTLQQEAQYTLMEFSSKTYSNSQARLAWILGSLAILKGITASTVTQLFFRPVSDANVEEMLLQSLCSK